MEDGWRTVQVRVGINLPAVSEEVPDLCAAARHAEQADFESVWVPDLIVGDGTPALDSMMALAGVAGMTEQVMLGFGVLVVPLRPLPWLAVQLATLQQLSGARVLLGVGAGGFPAAPFWQALGVTGRDRGRQTDIALQTLPELLAGEPVQLHNLPEAVSLTLNPAAVMPPVLVGGTSAAAMRRAVAHGDAWFPSLISPNNLASAVRRLRELSDERGCTTPTVTVGVHYLPTEQARAAFVHSLVDDHGRDPEEADKIAIAGSPEQLAAALHDYAAAGADRVVLAPTGDDWASQADTIAQARTLLG